MPSIDVDVANVPDIIEAQLTLSYSRLTDLIRLIVDQGNGHEDDIDELRDRLAQLVQENKALRAEVDTLKQAGGPSAEVTAAVEELRSTVAHLTERVDANTTHLAEADVAHHRLTEEVAHQKTGQEAYVKTTVAEHVDSLSQRVTAVEASLKVAQAFTDLWGVVPEQVLEMGRRTANKELEYSLADRISYLLSLPPFAQVQEELGVLRGLLQRQAADALAAKTSEAARTSRTASVVAAAAPGDVKDHTSELELLSNHVHALQLQMQVVQQQRLPPLEAALNSQEGRGSADDRIENTEKDVNRLYDQLSLLEDRLNTLLGLSAKEEKNGAAATNTTAAGVSHPGIIDLGRRVSLLEGTIEGLPRGAGSGNTPLYASPTSDGGAADTAVGGSGDRASADGENVSADGGAHASPRGTSGRPPSGRPSSSSGGGAPLLPSLTKDVTAVRLASASIPRRASSQQRHSLSYDVGQPTVEELRRQETARPAVAAGGRRISVAVEPDDGLRRRVAQVEENTAILEMNKADRRELQQLESALRQALAGVSRANPAHSAHSSPVIVPQRPTSAAGRFAATAGMNVADFAQGQRGEGFSRPASATSGLGRPMFVASSSAYLRDGAQFTNATVSSNSEGRL